MKITMKKYALFLLFLTSLLLNGCASQKPIDNETVKKLISAFNKNHEYTKVLDSFLLHAKNKNLTQMLSLTSNTTIKRDGLDHIKNIYKNVIIPEWSACKKTYTNKRIAHLTKEQTKVGPGFVYQKLCQKSNNEVITFNIMVLNEKGRISIASTMIIKPNKSLKKDPRKVRTL